MSGAECGIVFKECFQGKLDRTGLVASTRTHLVSNLCPVKIIAPLSLPISPENNVCDQHWQLQRWTWSWLHLFGV